jgi:uncharacterized metal-binding protein YceD (DUF177 family)
MKIIYSDIDGSTLHLETNFIFDDGADKINVLQFEGDLFVVDDINSGKGGFYLQGAAEVEHSTVCDRCGEPALMKLNVEISVNIERGEPAAIEAEFEMADEDGDAFYSEPDSLDLHELLRQEILLQLPTKRICGDGCAELNEAKPDIVYDDGEPSNTVNSLAALRVLKN